MQPGATQIPWSTSFPFETDAAGKPILPNQSFRYEVRGSCLYVTFTEPESLESCEREAIAIKDLVHRYRCRAVLVDSSQKTRLLGVHDEPQLIEFYHEHQIYANAIAVALVFDQAEVRTRRFWELASSDESVEVRVFTNRESASQWLTRNIVEPPEVPGELFERYLDIIRVGRATPTLRGLEKIIFGHMTAIPFENISKLYYWKTASAFDQMDLAKFLDGIEGHHFGGTCYANNYHLYQLLNHLGYDVALCGADMQLPNVHMVVLASVEGKSFILDAGYAAPFLMPLPRDLTKNYTVTLGSDRYVLEPEDRAGRSKMTLYRDGIPVHGYRVNPRPRRIQEFARVIADSYKPSAVFMNAALLVRFDSDTSYALHNFTSVESRGAGSVCTSLKSREELVWAIQDRFGISPHVSQVALNGLSLERDVWS